ncbi:hypothetical protein ACJIZ3_024997 [Penstemon smallii]|uniref:Uncharacterized protein n=1 Tax=Penstemon smallii TaxID=265156 RepID=A0ABD3TV40_9LAMI
MAELGFQDSRSGFRARDFSPDSVIFSLFSSASGSVERSSFASDVADADQYSLAFQVSQHLAGHEVLSGPDPDPNKSMLVHKNSVDLIRKQKAKVKKLDSSEAETTEDENMTIVSSRNSFSQALRECQERRLKSELLLEKSDHQRPASLDLNNSTINVPNSVSPRLVMKKPSAKPQRTGTFPSPGTPNYRHSSVGVQKGWSSERIPLHTSSSRRNVNTALLPYYNGKNLPSKWEDAERWIFSPVSGDGTTRTSIQQQPQRRPKSKSGPLGAPGVAYYQMFSPAAPMFEGGYTGKVIANSPFSAGVMAADGLSIQYRGCESSANFLVTGEPCMARSISVHGCSEMLGHSSFPQHQDEKYDGTEDASNNISRDVSRRDMATQMSPESSINSSPRRRSSFTLSTPSILPIVESQNMHSARSEIRDVPIDERVTVTRWSKKNKSKNPGTGNVDDCKIKAVSIGSLSISK